jgi:hypothetical protein
LEEALRANNMVYRGLPVKIYYDEPSGPEDAEMIAYPGEVDVLGQEESHPDPHLRGSGFGVLDVRFPNYSDAFSPWEVSMENMSISRPLLSEEENKLMFDTVSLLLRKESYFEHFRMPVDTARYSDYNRMVEVSMNLLFIKRRLETNYYASKLSAVADVRLIRDSCIKYNTIENELTRTAGEMCDEFEAKVLGAEEHSFIITEEEFTRLTDDSHNQVANRHVPTVRLRLRQRISQVASQNQSSSEARGRTRRQSSLESLPLPQQPATRRMGLRSEFEASTSQRRTRSRGPAPPMEAPTSQRRATRSRDPAPDDTEVLGRISRSRRLEANDEGAVDSNHLGTRRSARSSAPPNNYEEPESADESEDDAHQELGRASDGPARRERSSNQSSVVDENVSHDENDEKDEDELESPAARQTSGGRARGTRHGSRSKATSRRTRTDGDSEPETGASSAEESEAASHVSEEDDNVDSDEYEAKSITRRKTAPVAQQQVVRSSPRTKRRAFSVEIEDSPQRRSNRNAAKLHSSYKESASDLEAEEEESDDSAEQVANSRSRPRNVSARAQSSRPKRTRYEELPSDSEPEEEDVEEVPSSRGRSRKNRSYAELPSDFEEEEDFSDDEKPRSSRKRQQGKRRSKTSNLLFEACSLFSTYSLRTENSNSGSPVSKRKRAASPARIPQLSKWPEIKVKDITRVAKAVLIKVVR